MELPPSTISRREALRISAVAGVSLALGGGALAALIRAGRLQQVRVTRTRMGTLVTLTVVHPERAGARAMIEIAFGEMERLEGILSRHRPTTPLARLNRRGEVRGAPPELVHVLRRALAFSDLTGGAFDVTVAPLLELFERSAPAATSPGSLPTRQALARALSRVDYRALRVEDTTVRLERPGMAVTLDGIAKGYIVDRTLAVLVASGAERVLVDGGGDLASSGPEAPGEPWRVGLQHPREASGSLGVVRLRGEALATSGDYMRAFSGDRRHHHILDPRTGLSSVRTSAVSVVAPTAMDADALSTAAMVLGPEEGLAVLEGRAGVEGLIVGKDGGRFETTGFRRLGTGRAPAGSGPAGRRKFS